jgi:hypothetical protein
VLSSGIQMIDQQLKVVKLLDYRQLHAGMTWPKC